MKRKTPHNANSSSTEDNGGRRAGEGTALQKPPQTKYKASEKHVACLRTDEQDKGVEAVQRRGPW